VGRSAASVSYQLDFAEALIAGEKLGQNPANVPDMITISISSTDINGHAFGPDDPSQKELIVHRMLHSTHSSPSWTRPSV